MLICIKRSVLFLVKKAIQDTRERISSKNTIWAYPIIIELCSNHYTLVIKWIIECIKIYSFEFNSIRISEFEQYIQKALASLNALSSCETKDICREIWYHSDRDEIQTSLSRLWGAIAACKDGDERGGIAELNMAVELLLPDLNNNKLLEKYVESALMIYEVDQL